MRCAVKPSEFCLSLCKLVPVNKQNVVDPPDSETLLAHYILGLYILADTNAVLHSGDDLDLLAYLLVNGRSGAGRHTKGDAPIAGCAHRGLLQHFVQVPFCGVVV
jgi:hypothetical protein